MAAGDRFGILAGSDILPELPEVQTIIDALKTAGVEGKCIQRARVYWPNIIATSKPQWFCRRIKNKRIVTIGRRGKLIVSQLSEGLFLIIHLRMTGRFEIGKHTAVQMPHIHVVLELDDGRDLMYHDTRKFGRFYLTKNPDTITGGLGIEPLGKRFTARQMAQMLKDRRRQIKPLLLDQGFLAGLGNIYVDEALWASGIHPQRSAHSLTSSEAETLYRSIRGVLRQAIANAGTSLGHGLGNYAWMNQKRGRNSDALNVFRRTGESCLRCGYPIERIVVGQRGTHICRKCQKK
jgi:formamidopyrimidine-DNA glycosylase